MKKGERVHLHDGRVIALKADGAVPKRRRNPGETSAIRGFVRGALVDMVTGEEQVGDWHENVITTYGHGQLIRNFVGLAGSSYASFWGIGNMTGASNLFSTKSAMDVTEYGLHSTGGTSRATVSAGQQTLSGTWTLQQSFQYAATQISNNVLLNCIAQYGHNSVGAGSGYSFATFDGSSKSTTQALNITYNWLFST